MSRERLRDAGLFLLRAGYGVMFMIHGWPKLAGGAKLWEKLGAAVHHLGIDFGETFFGFAAAMSECVGGLLLLLGVAFRPACALLLCTMVVAATMHLGKGDGLGGSSHAIEAAFVFAALLLIGPGRWRPGGLKDG